MILQAILRLSKIGSFVFWEENLKHGFWKIKTFLTSKFHMKDQATGEITDTSYCHAHSLVYEVTEETDLTAMFDEISRRQQIQRNFDLEIHRGF